MSVVDSTSRMISRALADLTSLSNSRPMVKPRSEAKYREEVDSMSVAISGLSVDSRSVLKSELVVDSGSAMNSKRGKKIEQFKYSAGRIFSPPLYPPYSRLDLFRGSVWNIKGFIQSHVASPQVSLLPTARKSRKLTATQEYAQCALHHPPLRGSMKKEYLVSCL